MVILIAGTSHTGKTFLAQKLLEKYKYPYISIDHLKMGLIRSKYTDLSVEDDDNLEKYLWPIVREIIKTNIENSQNIIIEGAYIPFNFKDDFSEEYLKNIKYVCLIMTEKYIKNNILKIKRAKEEEENERSFTSINSRNSPGFNRIITNIKFSTLKFDTMDI